MIRFSILIICFIVVTSQGILAQQTVSASSDPGLLFRKTFRPLLEARLLDNDKQSNMLYRGSNSSLHLMVYNKGNATANECMVMISSDSRHIRPELRNEFFSLEPGDSIRIQVPFSLSQQVPPGSVDLSFWIEELKGYHLYPPRTFNFFIQEQSKFDLAVIDVGVQDRLGLGYFDKFEDVGLYFRVQNCSNESIHNISVKTELLPGTLPISVNPVLTIDSLNPRETYDIYAKVETGVSAGNIGVQIDMEAGHVNISQNFFFEFMGSYNTPEKMIADGCDQFNPNISVGSDEPPQENILPPTQPMNNKVAIIISNGDYMQQGRLNYAREDADLFKQNLISQMGYRNENIFSFNNLSLYRLENLFKLNGEEFYPLRRTLRRARQDVELTVFYVGYGAADLHQGEIYLLASNFEINTKSQKYPLMNMFGDLRTLMTNHSINKVITYLNINYLLLSHVGGTKEQDFGIAGFHKANSGFSTFISSSVHHTMNQNEATSSPFTSLIVEGLKGKADLNRDQAISARELYRFISDEFTGVPAKRRELHSAIQVPVFFGEDTILF